MLFERLEEELAAQPGVRAVTASLVPALSGSNWGSDVAVEGFQSGPDIDSHSRFNEVGPGYSRTMGIPVLAGREFTPADSLKAPKVAIVNEAFAKKFKLGRDAAASAWAPGREAVRSTRKIIGLDSRCLVLAGQGGRPADLLQPLPAGRSPRRDDVLRAVGGHARKRS